MFAQLAVDESIEQPKDSVGGSFTHESGIYPQKVIMAYYTESKGGAIGVVLHTGNPNGQEFKETIYVTSGKQKGQKNYYEKDGVRHLLPGFDLYQSLCQLTAGKAPAQMVTEKKIVKVWDNTQKKEVPTEVDVIMELLDQEVYVATLKVIEDKTKPDGQGNYIPTGETREVNTIDKFFRASDKMTYAESINPDMTEAEFFGVWETKNKGRTVDKSTKSAGTPGAPMAAAASKPAATQSLFS